MMSGLTTIAKRGCCSSSTLLNRLIIRKRCGGGSGGVFSSTSSPYRSMHHQSQTSTIIRAASSLNLADCLPPPINSLYLTSALSKPSLSTTTTTTIRYFGRKGSRMGHHIESFNEMAHNDSREEAKQRREEKKKKSKKARMSKESSDDVVEDDTFEDDMEGNSGDKMADDDFGPREDEFGNPLLPEIDAVRAKMLLVVASLERSFASIRGGEATAELFDAVRVSAYGETVPLSTVGQVVIEDSQRATISCYDPSVAPDVRDAVRDMPGMNLSPYIEEGGTGVVIIPIPRVSEETRTQIVKEIGRQSENGKQRVRKTRRSAMDIIKKGEKGKLDGISKDDAFRLGKEVEGVTEEVLGVLQSIVEKKQSSVMND